MLTFLRPHIMGAGGLPWWSSLVVFLGGHGAMYILAITMIFITWILIYLNLLGIFGWRTHAINVHTSTTSGGIVFTLMFVAFVWRLSKCSYNNYDVFAITLKHLPRVIYKQFVNFRSCLDCTSCSLYVYAHCVIWTSCHCKLLIWKLAYNRYYFPSLSSNSRNFAVRRSSHLIDNMARYHIRTRTNQHQRIARTSHNILHIDHFARLLQTCAPSTSLNRNWSANTGLIGLISNVERRSCLVLVIDVFASDVTGQCSRGYVDAC